MFIFNSITCVVEEVLEAFPVGGHGVAHVVALPPQEGRGAYLVVGRGAEASCQAEGALAL